MHSPAGFADAADPRLAGDIAATIASLQANLNSGREPALSR
ncbi:MAG: hypothetical protein OXC00_02015 [Acidimicrobiaceae bacterium]|nr:hypothetical protein [Acidimicrobiaceae bacterium]